MWTILCKTSRAADSDVKRSRTKSVKCNAVAGDIRKTTSRPNYSQRTNNSLLANCQSHYIIWVILQTVSHGWYGCWMDHLTQKIFLLTPKHELNTSLLNSVKSWHSNNTTKKHTVYRTFGSTSEAFIRTDFRCRSSVCKSHVWDKLLHTDDCIVVLE